MINIDRTGVARYYTHCILDIFHKSSRETNYTCLVSCINLIHSALTVVGSRTWAMMCVG